MKGLQQPTKINPHLPLRVFLSLLRERIEVRVLSVFFCTICVVVVCELSGCETANYAPIATLPRKVEGSKLEQGRQLFVRRCIECHTLPAIWKYSREDWPKIVNDMSHRANLSSADRDAVIAYILAVRAQQ